MTASAGSKRTAGPHDPGHMLIHVGRTLWDNVPASGAASLLVLIAASPALVVGIGLSWVIGWPLLMLCTGAVWAGIVAACARLLDGDACTLPAILGLVRQHARSGIRISIVPAIVGPILLGSLHLIDQNPDAGWIMLPLFLDLGVAIVVGTSLVTIYTLAIERRASGTELWLASAIVTISRPVPVLGTLTLFGVAAWMAVTVGPIALIAVAPLAMLCVAVTREAWSDPPAGGALHD